MRKYITIDTSTLQGLKRAEALQRRGWTTVRVGLFLLTMMKVTP